VGYENEEPHEIYVNVLHKFVAVPSGNSIAGRSELHAASVNTRRFQPYSNYTSVVSTFLIVINRGKGKVVPVLN